jgi:hypothetical protein
MDREMKEVPESVLRAEQAAISSLAETSTESTIYKGKVEEQIKLFELTGKLQNIILTLSKEKRFWPL